MRTKMKKNSIFLSREMSWLEFNARVLDEAGDKSNALLDRLKFIAIFCNNLDEFFMVRVAGLRQLRESTPTYTDPAGYTAEELIKNIKKRLTPLLRRLYGYLHQDLLPLLAAQGIRLLPYVELKVEQRALLRKYFINEVLPVLTPLSIDPTHPFPLLSSGLIQIAVSLSKNQSDKNVHAVVEVPAGLSRFIPITGESDGLTFITLEDLIIDNIDTLFHGCTVHDAFPFRITRDMDFELREDGIADLLEYLSEELRRQKHRRSIRLEVPSGKRGKLAEWLLDQFDLENDLKYHVPWPLNPAAFFGLIDQVNRPNLMEENWPAVATPEFSDSEQSMFEIIDRHESVFLTPPFRSFEPITRLLSEAADDPDVLAIKMTLYRVSGNSPVVSALQRAAENGKQVTVIVELKARFDESNNIQWANRLEESGAHVVYGIAGLKIHCKALLIVRKDAEGLVRRYVHLGTGNYNDKTARIYTDCGLFLNDPQICAEVAALFNIMTGYSTPQENWSKVFPAPFELRRKLLELIDRETRVSSKRHPGHIIAKMNSLVDPEVIEHLYAAARAGVKIDLIVRGICCLNPGVKTNNIRVISIVDRYLEHTRAFYFHNGGAEEYYLASADWMPRNLDHRIELMFPVEAPNIRQMLRKMIDYQLNDQCKGRHLQTGGTYSRVSGARFRGTRSQRLTYLYFQQLAAVAIKPQNQNKLKIHRKLNNN